MKRLVWLGFVLVLDLICSGCGQTFRPIIIPNPPTFPNPAAAHSVVSINDNGAVVAGSAMVVDVAGDSIDGIKNVGLHPVYAVLQSSRSVLVVNQSVAGTAADSVTELAFSGTSIVGAFTITMPVGSAPNFIATTESTQAYVSLPSFFLDPVNHPGDATVAVINTSTNSTVAEIMVGNTPVAMAETPDGAKLYVANKGDGTISAFNTVDRSARSISGSLTSPPIWLSARNDSQQVYVLEQNGTLAYMNTTTTAGPDTLTETSSPPIQVTGAIKMVYDPNLNRLYIPGGSAVAVVDVSQSPPTRLASFAITPVAPSTRGAQDPCSTTAPTTLNTVDVAALPDGSHAYVGSYYEDASDNICPQATVIDATSISLGSPIIAIPGFPAYDAFCSNARFRISMAPGGDSSRAYLASCDGGNVNIINTATNSYLENQLAPAGTRQASPPGPENAPQNPVFLLAGP